jgi:hypothetical protein
MAPYKKKQIPPENPASNVWPENAVERSYHTYKRIDD